MGKLDRRFKKRKSFEEGGHEGFKPNGRAEWKREGWQGRGSEKG